MPVDTTRPAEQRLCCCSCEHLTARELDVLCAVAAGHTNNEVAQLLHLSVHTVARYLTSMLHKTGARTRTALVNDAYRIGVLAVSDRGPLATGRRCLPR